MSADEIRDALGRYLTEVRAVGVRAIYAPGEEGARQWSLYLEERRANVLVVAELLRIPGISCAAASLTQEGAVHFELDDEAFTEWASEWWAAP